MPLSKEAQFQVDKAERTLARRRELERTLLEGAERVAKMLREEFGARRVLLFGSIGRPWFHENSDVDLAVEGVDVDELDRATERACEMVGRKVDLVALEEAQGTFREHVLLTGRELS